MVDVASLIALQTDVAKVASDYGVTVKTLTSAELKKFGLSFDRQFIRQYPNRQIQDILQRHQGEILLGAMAAKEQMNANIDGELPDAGKIGGPLAIRACWLGIGDDWEDILGIHRGTQAYWGPGEPRNWIHSNTSLLAGGTADRPIKIGENAVHVVVGLASYHPVPKIESIKFEIDGKEKPVLITKWAQLSPFSMKIKELDRGFIWEEDATILGNIFISAAFGAAITEAIDYPYLFGASFIKEDALRLHDPVAVAAAAAKVVTAT